MAGERTEQATPQKLKQLREQGRVVKSTDLIMALELAAGFWCLQTFGGEAIYRLRGLLTASLTAVARPDLSDAVIADLWTSAGLLFLGVMAPLLLLMPVLGIAANVGQSGLLFSGQALSPDLNRINPLAGLQRLFSVRSVVELVKSLFKIGLVAYLISRPLTDDAASLLVLATTDFQSALPRLAGVVLHVGMSASLLLLALGAIDFGYQRWEFLRSAMMTKQELKEELRQSEGDVQMKGRIRQLQRKLARSRMMQDVPQATVVVTNPTHLAIALQYEPGEMPAPKVVAKGADHIAANIRRLAAEHGVPLVENKPLAQALYRMVDVGGFVPGELFQAVAEVLAYIYMLNARASQQPAPRPAQAPNLAPVTEDGYGA